MSGKGKTWEGATIPGPGSRNVSGPVSEASEVAEMPDRRNGPAPIVSGAYKGASSPVLDKKEARLITGLLRRLDPVEAARNAGYGEPEISVYEVLGRPHVQEALKARALRHVFGRLLPTALRAHDELLSDPSTPASARMQAIKSVYDLANLTSETEAQTSRKNSRPLSDMSADELRDLIEGGRKALSEIEVRAIDITPDDAT